MYRILRSNKMSMVRSRLLQLEMHIHDIEEVGKEGIDELHALVRSSHTSIIQFDEVVHSQSFKH